MKKGITAIGIIILVVFTAVFLAGCESLVEMAERANLRAAQEREARQARVAARDTTYGITDKVGTPGPAGGLIFYDKGNNTGGWQYMEVAPAGAEFSAAWGGRGLEVGETSQSIQSGSGNTERIVSALGTREPYEGRNDYAARKASTLSYGGYRDWFLPSIAELEAIAYNIDRLGKGDFSQRMAYLSSSEYDTDTVRALIIGYQHTTGDQILYEKDQPALVRPVRRF